MARRVLCVDIGGSKLMAGIMDESGRLLVEARHQFLNPTKEQVVEAIFALVQKVLEQSDKPVCAIGVSIPGLADPQAGIWVYAPFSKIENLNICEVLKNKFNLPVYIENDGNICTYGEKRFGVAKDVSDFMWVTVSNGVGGGIFLGNKLFAGFSKNAGEIGHIKVVENGRKCPCGGRGCTEAYCAASGVMLTYNEICKSEKNLSAKQIAELAYGGNKEAILTFEQEGRFLAKAIAAAVNIINVPLVVIGGGISQAFDLFEQPLKIALSDYLFTDGNKSLEIKRTSLGYEAALISAGAYALFCIEQG